MNKKVLALMIAGMISTQVAQAALNEHKSALGQFLCDLMEIVHPRWTSGEEKIVYMRDSTDMTRVAYAQIEEDANKDALEDAKGTRFVKGADDKHVFATPDPNNNKIRPIVERVITKEENFNVKHALRKDALHLDCMQDYVYPVKSYLEKPYFLAVWSAIAYGAYKVGQKAYDRYYDADEQVDKAFDDFADEADEILEEALQKVESAQK